MVDAAPTVVVTGATGFVASELVKQLLEKGYTVRGTVRSLQSESKVEHLGRLGKALRGHLTLHEADLLQEGSFDAIIPGSSYVFHTASPFFIETSNPQEDLIDPALNGTANVLRSAAKAKSSLKRVILTSSVAAVHGEYAAPPKNGKLYTEEDWNETSTIDTQPYHRSKVVAEQEAWKIAEESGLDLVTILPNFVLGPVLSTRTDGTSVGFLKGVAEGTPVQGTPLICDVRDVARAHVLAAEVSSASGRYIVSHRAPLTATVLSKALQERFPQFVISDVPEQQYDTSEKIDNSKAERELGLQLTPAVTTFIDGIVTLVQLGITQPLPSGANSEGTPAV